MDSSFRHQRSGFTLIELIAVILIACILAISALPRVTHLRSEAYHASLDGTLGAFRSAILLANLICQAKNGAGTQDLAGYGDGDVDFNARCFPTAPTASNGNGNGNNGNGNGNGGGNGSNGNGNGNGNNGNGNGNGGNNALTAEGCATIWNQILSIAPSISPAAGSDYLASTSGNSCIYTLTRDRSARRSFYYDTLSGTVAILENP